MYVGGRAARLDKLPLDHQFEWNHDARGLSGCDAEVLGKSQAGDDDRSPSGNVAGEYNLKPVTLCALGSSSHSTFST